MVGNRLSNLIAIFKMLVIQGTIFVKAFSPAMVYNSSEIEGTVRDSFRPYNDTWSFFVKKFGRQYDNKTEETHRFNTFLNNLKTMEVHNAKFLNGNTTFWMGINQFSDMTLEEFVTYNELNKGNNKTTAGLLRCTPFKPPQNYTLPRSVDWRSKGYVTEVKNQGPCGCCWAFSTAGSLEGQLYRRTQKLVSLSAQQLVDCTTPFGTLGCQGGNEPPAYAYIHSAGGIESEQDYPFVAKDQKCSFVRSKSVTSLSGCHALSRGSEKQLQQAVAAQGPISTNIYASLLSFMLYAGGVYSDPNCKNDLYDLNHAVLAVGYGSSGGLQYWIVKNSWSTLWGEQGYFRIARNKDNMCGIAVDSNFPVL